MRFENVRTTDAIGTVLGHTHRLRIAQTTDKETEKETTQRLSKGTLLNAKHIDMLLQAGVDSVMVAVLETDDVLENVAVERLALLFRDSGVGVESSRQGRCNLYALHRGVLDYDVSLIHRLNALDWRVGMAIEHGGVVEAGTVFASIKVIPYAVPRTVLDAWESALKSERGVEIYPLHRRHVALVVSQSSEQASSIQRIVDVHRSRIEGLGSQIDRVYRCEHTVESIAQSLQSMVMEVWDLVLFYGETAVVDIDDVLPLAIRSVGGEVERVGMPVEPGNMLLLGSIQKRPIVGVPRCAQHIQQSGLDLVLARALSGAPLSSLDIARLGVGGYLKRNDSPIVPKERRHTIGAVVLMAGLSSRMKGANKLSMSIPKPDGDGNTTVSVQTVQRVLSAGYAPVVVVTGYQEREIRALLQGLPVRFVHNPAFADGMGTSIAKAFSVLSGWDAGLLALGDMPFVSPTILKEMYQRSTEYPEHIVVPMHKARRGHPIIFPSALFAELQQCTGDVGARSVLQNHQDIIERVNVSDMSIFWDVDTEDLLRRYVECIEAGQS